MSIRIVVGAAFVIVAILANPWFLERFVVLDGSIARKWPVVVADLALAVVGIASLASARRARSSGMPRRQRWFAAIAIGFAFLLSVLLGEVALRLFVSPEIVLKTEKAAEYRWRARHADPDKGLREGPYDYDRFDPLFGWLPARQYANNGVQTNSLGIRATREYAFERVPGVRRIVLIGDSFTWGEQTWSTAIRNEETFAAQLEANLPATEAINLGVHGWGTDQQLLYLRELGLRFHPDLVILGFFESDLDRNVADFHGYMKPRFYLENGELVLANTPVPDGEALLETPFELPSFYLGALVAKGLDNILDRTKLRPIEGREAWQVTRAIFEAAKRESESAGAEFLLVDIPFGVRRQATSIERTVAAWAKATQTHYVSLREHFITLPREKWDDVNDGHFTAMGHLEASKALMQYIEQASLLPDRELAGMPVVP